MEDLQNKNSSLNLDFFKLTSSQISDQIRQADTKAAALFGILGILTGALLNKVNSVRLPIWIDRPVSMLMILVSFLMIILTFKFIFVVIYPRYVKSKIKSLSFFSDIITFSKEEYYNNLSSLNNDKFLNVFSNNIWNLSQVAEKKYGALRRAFVLAILSMVFTITVLIFT